MDLNNSQKHIKKNNTNRTVSIDVFLCACYNANGIPQKQKTLKRNEGGVSKNPAIEGMKKPFHIERVHTIVLKGFYLIWYSSSFL